MSWFDTSGLTSFAKTALKEAQRTIDKALDIQNESGEEQDLDSPLQAQPSPSPNKERGPPEESPDLFASWGLTVSAESAIGATAEEPPVVTESPSKSKPEGLWGSFAGSFFEQPKLPETASTIIRPPKAKSMNMIADNTCTSQDDLFTKSQLVMTDNVDRPEKGKLDEAVPKAEGRRSSSRSNCLSLVSSRNSSDSVEILSSQSLKTTPDSEAASVHSVSHSSSAGQKLNSESVEILPDSLVSPSSIECLGFDSYSSDKNSSPSSNLSYSEMSDKKAPPIGDLTERPETADSVSLVADDDDDTISYNSVSECTAPTVLDTDEKPANPYMRTGLRNMGDVQRRVIEKDFIHLDKHIVVPSKIQISENSSNDGSWSDKTLNADSDNNIEDTLKTRDEQEDGSIDRLSDSSSFYNVAMSSNMIQSESSMFVNVDKQLCATTDSNDSSQKESSIKERNSPISSDSKSDLVKIGSDRTSGHTSGDELETATSSDIEIIPSPNGDHGHGFCRSSPGKYCQLKQSKVDGSTSPNLVDLVLGKTLATRIRGHNRELSEASVQSNTSDESQGSENERLMRRLCEMADILETRESRLLEVSRNNAELADANAELKGQLDALLARHELADVNSIAEDYTQRMSALEKKFQQAIREKDQLRKQLDSLKSEMASRKNSSQLESALSEKDEIIGQLQEEGEKLARQELQHSNIIKKLRAKEKDNDQVIKSLRDKIVELTAELDRLKRSASAKEELEVSQMEAVYRLTAANKKMETELNESKSALDDARQRLETSRVALEAARRELAELQRSSDEMRRRRDRHHEMQQALERAEAERDQLRVKLDGLRAHALQEEKRWAGRTEALRRELASARELVSSLEAGAAGGAGAGEAGAAGGCGCGEAGAGPLLAQLAALQRAALERDQAHRTQTRALHTAHAEAEASLAKSVERERVVREEAAQQHERVAAVEAQLADARRRLDEQAGEAAAALEGAHAAHRLADSKEREMQELRAAMAVQAQDSEQLRRRLSALERDLAAERTALDTERRRTAALMQQASCRGDVSPPHSLGSDSLSATLWPQEEGSDSGSVSAVAMSGAGAGAGAALCGVEELVARLQRREGEARALAAAAARLGEERRALAAHAAQLAARLEEAGRVQSQYDELLQMYGEKEEQLAELQLDLADVTALYKAQLDELVALKSAARAPYVAPT